MGKRFISIVTLLLLITLNIYVLLPSVFAKKSDEYTYTDKYKTSSFYNDLQALTLTGDHRFDVISVAITQLGYHEGDSEDDFDGMNSNGTGDFVEYNVSYGIYDPDVGHSYSWCASFVSWCLRQAKIPMEIAPSEISCHRMISNHYKEMERYELSKSKGGEYVPKTGDIIFFEPTEGSPFISNHVGLVIGTKDGKVYTIEGNINNSKNSGNRVAYQSYLLSDTYIVGYGTPDYTEIDGTDYSVFELIDNDDDIPAGLGVIEDSPPPKSCKLSSVFANVSVIVLLAGSATLIIIIKKH